jgi:hypothetical protein
MVLPTVRRAALVLAAYVAAAIAASWPLARHLTTHLTGPPTSDAGVYLWNTWVFRYELVDRGSSPFTTETILPLDGPTPLSLHNYTVMADLVSLAIQPLVGLLAAFNILYLANVVLAAVAMFLLARRATRAMGTGAVEAWLAGLLFAWSPLLVARSTGHFSLAAAAPLPLFALAFDRALDRRRASDALWSGICFAWAALSDAYYGIYCLMLAGCLLAYSQLSVEFRGRDPRHRRAVRILDGSIVAIAVGTLALRLIAGDSFQIGPFAVTLGTLHTPALAVAVLGAIRLALSLRPRVRVSATVPPRAIARLAVIGGTAAAILLSPTLITLFSMVARGELIRAPVNWRSSAPGLDLLSFVLPNPMHAGQRPALIAWLDTWPNGWIENVASIPFVAIATILAARWLAGYRMHRLWLGITVAFAVLSMGPFLRIAGIATPVPLPWALLRYLPVIGDARMPARMAVVAMLGFSVIFAAALGALSRRYPARRAAIVSVVGLGLALELVPAPRVLHEVRIPEVYRIIAADPRPIRVLHLPFGISDGLASTGRFSASTQVYQTFHEKGLIGGYLSRVPPPTRRVHLDTPLLAVLAEFSEGRTPPPAMLDAARASASALVRNARIGYVVVDTTRVNADLLEFAVKTFDLTLVSTSDQFLLYRPAAKPMEDVGG